MVSEGEWRENLDQGTKLLLQGRDSQHTLDAPRKFNQIRMIGKQVSFYLTVRKLITFAGAVSMEWRDWKPDCSGLTSEWETASVDNSLQTRGHLASGR